MELEPRLQEPVAPPEAVHHVEPDHGDFPVTARQPEPVPVYTTAPTAGPGKPCAASDMLAGYVLGALAAAVSLLANVVGATATGRHPLELIRAYLTFPFGPGMMHTDNVLLLALGCGLYVGTGMLLGLVFQYLLSRKLAGDSALARFVAVSGLSLVVWLVSFYGVLWWLQHTLFGGSWVVDQVPWWVGALTNLAFGWTMLAAQPLRAWLPRPGRHRQET